MKIISTLSSSFLFKGLSEEEINSIIDESPPTTAVYKRGELIFSSENEEKKVGLVIDGKCEIRISKGDGAKTVLNNLGPNDSFGILSVYSAEDFPTQIFASTNCEVLFFTAEQIALFVNNYSQISLNLINFLANRIAFLNKKIATFSGNRVENRLAAFILSEADSYGTPEFPFNRQKTAEKINAGRASVYRALASLEAEGLIRLDEKQIIITDRKGLERIIK